MYYPFIRPFSKPLVICSVAEMLEGRRMDGQSICSGHLVHCWWVNIKFDPSSVTQHDVGPSSTRSESLRLLKSRSSGEASRESGVTHLYKHTRLPDISPKDNIYKSDESTFTLNESLREREIRWYLRWRDTLLERLIWNPGVRWFACHLWSQWQAFEEWNGWAIKYESFGVDDERSVSIWSTHLNSLWWYWFGISVLHIKSQIYSRGNRWTMCACIYTVFTLIL